MSKGGVEGLVLPLLKAEWDRNPVASFEDVARNVYLNMEPEDCAKFLRGASGRGLFTSLSRAVVNGVMQNASDIKIAMAVDLMRICAIVEDDWLRARIDSTPAPR